MALFDFILAKDAEIFHFFKVSFHFARDSFLLRIALLGRTNINCRFFINRRYLTLKSASYVDLCYIVFLFGKEFTTFLLIFFTLNYLFSANFPFFTERYLFRMFIWLWFYRWLLGNRRLSNRPLRLFKYSWVRLFHIFTTYSSTFMPIFFPFWFFQFGKILYLFPQHFILALTN